MFWQFVDAAPQGLKTRVLRPYSARLKSFPYTKDGRETSQIQRHAEGAETSVLILCYAGPSEMRSRVPPPEYFRIASRSTEARDFLSAWIRMIRGSNFSYCLPRVCSNGGYQQTEHSDSDV